MESWAGYPASVSRALDILQSEGPSLGFHVNLKKCELFSPSVLSLFPTSIPSSNIPNFKLLGVPIGDTAFCSSFTARKCSSPLAQLSHLEDIGSSDPHVALILLRQCASFCKLIHLARGTPSSSMVEALKAYDLAVAICFTKCTGLDISVDAWKQAQLSPRRGGLGLRPLSLHAPAAYISSLCSSDSATPSHPLLASTITLFNNCVPPPEAVSVQTLLSNLPTQRYLSDVIEESQFAILYNSISCANKARLLSVSSPHASAWLSVVPSEVMGLHLNPCELNTAVKWWLGLNPHSENNAIPHTCPLCPESMLDPLCHHSVTCKRGGRITCYAMQPMRLAARHPCQFAWKWVVV